MKKRISLFAPAKINLHLRIGRVRPDGFHDLQSLFHLISLGDDLTMESGQRPGECTIDGQFSCPARSNLIYLAYHRFAERTGVRGGVRFRCEKRIPEGAGLGGGSSDAAAALRLLDLYFDTRLSSAELAELGAALGSDVPFFLTAPAALVEGRGERIEALEALREYPLLLVQPDFSVATGKAYRLLDEYREAGGREDDGNEEASASPVRHYLRGPEAGWGFFNSFTPVLASRYPLYEEFFSAARAAGALYSNITGSGSACFALFRDAGALERCESALPQSINKRWKVKMLASYPQPVYN